MKGMCVERAGRTIINHAYAQDVRGPKAERDMEEEGEEGNKGHAPEACAERRERREDESWQS